ncbi:MAG: hypothetical protein KF729_04835 [Sandaracinaceae bacterium]|nr:hypothetical protein [Sandaracinaceae bacterium]
MRSLCCAMLVALTLAGASACDGDDPRDAGTDAAIATDAGVDGGGGPDDGGVDASVDGGGVDGGVSRLTRPPELPRPPAGRLPAELFPPR